MKRINVLRLSGLAVLGSLIATSSFAQEARSPQEPGYYYGGISIGQSRAKIDEPRITANLLAGGLSTSGMTRDESDTAYRLFGGYQFNRYFGLEAAYFNLGEFGFTSTTVPAGSLNGRMKVQGVSLDLVGTLPVTERLSAIARVGAQYAKSRDTFSGSGAVNVLDRDPSKSAANYKVGIGLQYEVNRSFLIRAEGERYRIDDAVGNKGDINVFSVSAVFPIGRAAAPTPRPMAASTYVAPAPAPAPAAAPVVTPAPAPAPRRVNFSADSLFAFDRSELRPEGKAALDRFAKEVSGTRFDVIRVEGYTDRLGSPAYNEKLSLQRAEAVKSYLVISGGINPAKISAVGKGESAPVTKLADCKGSAPSAKLIACLQPDRRVEVEVSGTR